MVSMVRGGCRFPFRAVALASGLWIISSSSAMAQGGASGAGGGQAAVAVGGRWRPEWRRRRLGGGMGGMGGGMAGMGHTGAFGMSGVTAPGMGNGVGRMSGMGTGYGYGQTSGYGSWAPAMAAPTRASTVRVTAGLRRSGLGYGGSGWVTGSGLGYGGSGLGYGCGGCGYALYGSAPGNYYYPYASSMYPTANLGFGNSSTYVAPAAGTTNPVAYQGRYLGIDEEPVVDASGRKGMKVARVYPGTPAERAGLEPGDVIYSINGFLIERRGNLAWIIANSAANNVLKMDVRTIRDDQEHTVTAQTPVSPPRLERLAIALVDKDSLFTGIASMTAMR